MENKKFEQIINTVEELNNELKPLYDEMLAFRKVVASFDDKQHISNSLNELIKRITKTARRHNAENTVDLSISNDSSKGHFSAIVGTNHNGLGYSMNSTEQLSPLTNNNNGYYFSNGNIQRVRDVLFDSDVVIELTSIIKKSHQKTFLKVVNILKKSNLLKTFDSYIQSQLKEVMIQIDKIYNLKVDLNHNYSINYSLCNREYNIVSWSIHLDNITPPIDTKVEENEEIFKEISKFKFCEDFDLNEIRYNMVLAQHKDELIKKIKTLKEEMLTNLKQYKAEDKELTKLLQPFLALDKL